MSSMGNLMRVASGSSRDVTDAQGGDSGEVTRYDNLASPIL